MTGRELSTTLHKVLNVLNYLLLQVVFCSNQLQGTWRQDYEEHECVLKGFSKLPKLLKNIHSLYFDNPT